MKIPARLSLGVSYLFLLTSEFPLDPPFFLLFSDFHCRRISRYAQMDFGFKSGQDTNMAAQKINTVGFLSEFERRHKLLPDRPFCWVLGSGASFQLTKFLKEHPEFDK